MGHPVESLHVLNALVNFWVRMLLSDGHAARSGLPACCIAILAFRARPRAQRQAWRGLFAHFAFNASASQEHSSPARRGGRGALCAEQVEALLS